jgi:hypothetical protein
MMYVRLGKKPDLNDTKAIHLELVPVAKSRSAPMLVARFDRGIADGSGVVMSL